VRPRDAQCLSFPNVVRTSTTVPHLSHPRATDARDRVSRRPRAGRGRVPPLRLQEEQRWARSPETRVAPGERGTTSHGV
jgi:hypothetical protein